MLAKRTTSHGPPLLGEPVPLELANTVYAAQGQLQDGLQTTGDLVNLLRSVRSRLKTALTDADLSTADDTQLTRARDLRDAVRELARASVEDGQPQASAVDQLNQHAAAGPRWPELRWGTEPHTEACSSAPPMIAALSEIAEAAVELLASPQRRDIRICGAPSCVLFFLRDHPRRAWCSTACGNRARVARHYQRSRAQRR